MNNELTIIEAMRKVTEALKDYVDTNYQPKIDNSLATENKTVTGAINELLNKGMAESEKEVINAATHYDFPSIGNVNYIYKAYNEKKTYQWNEESLSYEPLDEDTLETADLEIIHGGSANGNS